MEITQLLIRLLMTFVFAYLFGLDRQKSNKSVGFGTFIFVSVGSCALTLATISLQPENFLPVFGAIVTGIGFLGAGALIRNTDKIFGFTTAASLWVFAILGLIIGAGQYVIGIALYVLVWSVIIFDKQLEKKGLGSYKRKIIINMHGIVNTKEVEKSLANGIRKYHLLSKEIDKKNNKGCLIYLIEGTKKELNKKLNRIYSKEWCDSIKIE